VAASSTPGRELIIKWSAFLATAERGVYFATKSRLIRGPETALESDAGATGTLTNIAQHDAPPPTPAAQQTPVKHPSTDWHNSRSSSPTGGHGTMHPT
jgi:hypothetical protein